VEVKTFQNLPGLEFRPLGHPDLKPAAIPTELYRLSTSARHILEYSCYKTPEMLLYILQLSNLNPSLDAARRQNLLLYSSPIATFSHTTYMTKYELENKLWEELISRFRRPKIKVTLRLTVSQSVSRAPLWDLRPDITSCQCCSLKVGVFVFVRRPL
jgi:hypothetical protein